MRVQLVLLSPEYPQDGASGKAAKTAISEKVSAAHHWKDVARCRLPLITETIG